jgi:Holliday junction resolvase RusA-like endonuclease
VKQVRLVIYGTPVPQGSKNAFYIPKLGRSVIVENNKKTKPWRQEIAGAAGEAMRIQELELVQDCPVSVRCCFFFDRPKSLKKAIRYKLTKPDIDKLARSTLDALTGVVFKDDSLVVHLTLDKMFDERPRVEIEVDWV